MASTETIFKLNDVDYSDYVVASDYNINLKDVFQEWVDGGQVKHRDVVAQKLQGTFQMYFTTSTELQTFLTALANCKTSANTYPVKMKANNKTVASLQSSRNVFLDFEPVRKRDQGGANRYDIIEVTVEEP